MFLPNLNRTQAAERAEKCRFLTLVSVDFDPLILTFQLVQTSSRGNLVQICSAVPKIFHTQTKSHRQCQKQNLAQFTACSNKLMSIGTVMWNA